MENNEVMVTEMMPEEEFVEVGSNGVIGFIAGLLLGGTGVAFGKLLVNKIKSFRENRKAKKAQAEIEAPKQETVEVE